MGDDLRSVLYLVTVGPSRVVLITFTSAEAGFTTVPSLIIAEGPGSTAPFPNYCCRVSLNFGVFVEKCVMRCASLTSTSDKLDTLLRRAACLDPKAFCAVLERCEGMARICGCVWLDYLPLPGHRKEMSLSFQHVLVVLRTKQLFPGWISACYVP